MDLGERFAKPVTTVQVCVSACVKPRDIFEQSSGQFPAMFVDTENQLSLMGSRDISSPVCALNQGFLRQNMMFSEP